MTLIRLLLLLQQSKQQRRLTFRNQISLEARRRRDHRIPRHALQHPSMSAFSVLYGSGSDQALLTLCGFDHRSMQFLHDLFHPMYHRYSPYSSNGYLRLIPTRPKKKGRPQSMTSVQCLALTLTWYRTRGSTMVLCALFGITASVCSLFLRFGRRLLIRVLVKTDEACIRMPTDAEIQSYNAAISAKYSLLPDVYAVADGLKLYLQQSSNAMIQNIFYNGWTHDHYVGNVFVFAPSGVVIACSFNAPGSMHDSAIAEWGSIYQKLEDVYERTGGTCVVDSAFSRGQYPFLIKSSQNLPDTAVSAELHRARQATSARQGSEWGMRAFQGSFPRLKDRIIYEERGERRLILHLVILLFNLRSRLVGMNQILTNFMPHLSVEANTFLLPR